VTKSSSESTLLVVDCCSSSGLVLEVSGSFVKSSTLTSVVLIKVSSVSADASSSMAGLAVMTSSSRNVVLGSSAEESVVTAAKVLVHGFIVDGFSKGTSSVVDRCFPSFSSSPINSLTSLAISVVVGSSVDVVPSDAAVVCSSRNSDCSSSSSIVVGWSVCCSSSGIVVVVSS